MRLTLIGAASVLTVGLAGCDGYDQIKTRNSVLEEFPNGEVLQVPGRRWQYLVRDETGAVWVAETMNHFDSKVTGKTLVFPARQR